MSSATGGSGVYGFGPFRLDPAERLLLRNGQPVSLTPKAFDILAYLVERQGHLIEKQVLLSALWPDTIVEEANLAWNISTIRKALGDGGDDGKFIETVPTRGYRFVALVTVRQPAPDSGSRPFAYRRVTAAVALLIVGAAAAGFWVKPKFSAPVARPAPVFTKLTANPPEGLVIRAKISPDGRYLAYSDRTGIQVQVIDTGDVQALPDTRGMVVLGWRGDGTNLQVLDNAVVRRVWDVSLVGNARRPTGLVWPDDGLWIGPDGSVVKLMPDGDMRLDSPHGASRSIGRVEHDWIRWAVWTPDAKRVFFLRGDHPPGLETFAVEGGAPSVVFTPPDGQYIRVIGDPGRDGRMIVLMGRRVGKVPGAVSVWELRTDPRTGSLVEEPRQLTDWRELGCDQISSSADGRRVVLLTATHQLDVYVAAFDAQAARLDTPRLLSPSNFDDRVTAWAPDNRSVIFSSKRGEYWNLYEQATDGGSPKLLVANDNDKDYVRVTGDGRWLLFKESKSLAPPTEVVRIMRAAIEGGLAEEIYASEGNPAAQCSISGGCIVYDHHGDKAIISSLDPSRGKGAALATVPITGSGYILPNGTEFAYIVEQDQPRNHIRVISFRGRRPEDIVVRGATFLDNLDPLPDGSGWLSVDHTPDRSELLFITRDGRSHVLWAPDRTTVDSAIPSRDGKHLAIETDTPGGNVWMMSDF